MRDFAHAGVDSRCARRLHARKRRRQVRLHTRRRHAVLDNSVTNFVWDGVRSAFVTMAELQFAAGQRPCRGACSARRSRAWPGKGGQSKCRNPPPLAAVVSPCRVGERDGEARRWHDRAQRGRHVGHAIIICATCKYAMGRSFPRHPFSPLPLAPIRRRSIYACAARIASPGRAVRAACDFSVTAIDIVRRLIFDARSFAHRRRTTR